MLMTSAKRLRASYGQAGMQRVLAAIGQLMKARDQRGVRSRLVLIETGIAELGVPGAMVAPEPIAAQIAQLSAALLDNDDRLESVLLIGGPEIVPFHHAANPTPYDGDMSVPGDFLYGAGNPFARTPSWSVGRIPGAAGSDPALLLKLLEYAASYTTPKPGPQKAFGYCTAAWQWAAAEVYAEIDQPGRILVSPPVEVDTFDHQLLDQARFIYFNLHGVVDGPHWYGQSVVHGALVLALRPSDLSGLDFRGAVVVSEACYGAAIEERNQNTSLALAFLERGAAAFVGVTAISYGPPSPPIGEADLIALYFLRAVKEPGTTLGAAFLAAREGMLDDTLAQQLTLDEDDQKTLMEFVLYGDPTLVIS